jgi:hypothetical protein
VNLMMDLKLGLPWGKLSFFASSYTSVAKGCFQRIFVMLHYPPSSPRL